jgi:hypothetical protein
MAAATLAPVRCDCSGSLVGMSEDVVTALYRQFDPLRPLAADESRLYVDWQGAVGIEDVKATLAAQRAVARPR